MAGRLVLPTLLLLSLLSLSLPLPTHADTKQWAVLNGAWSNDANWLPAGVPGQTDDVIIQSNENLIVTLDNQASIKSLVLGGDSGVGKQTLLLSGAILSLTDGGTVTQSGVLDVASGTIEGTGTLVVDGLAKFRDLSTKTIAHIGLTINGNMTLDAGGIELQDGAVLEISQTGTLTVTSKNGIVNTDKTNTVIHNSGTIISNSGLDQDYVSTFSSSVNNDVGGVLHVKAGKLMVSNNGDWSGVLQVDDSASIEMLAGNHTFESTSVVSGNGTVYVSNSAYVDLMGTLQIRLFDVNGGGAIVSAHSDKGITFDQLNLKNGQLEGDSAVVADLDWEGGSMSLKEINIDNLKVVGSLARTVTGTNMAIGSTATFLNDVNVLLYEQAAVIISDGASMVLDTQVYFLCGINDTTSTVQVEGKLYVNYTAGIQVTCSLLIQKTGVIFVEKASVLSVQAPLEISGELSVSENSSVELSVGGPAYVGSKIWGLGRVSCYACSLTLQGYVSIGEIEFTGGYILFQQDQSADFIFPYVRVFNQSGSSVLELRNNAEVGLNLTIDNLEFTGGTIKSNLNSVFGVYSSLIISENAHFYGGSPVLMQDLSYVNYGETRFSGSQPAELSGRNVLVNDVAGKWFLDGQITFSQSDQESGAVSSIDNYGFFETEESSTVVLALNFNNYGLVSVREQASLSIEKSVYTQQGSIDIETVLFAGTLSSPNAINILTGRLMGYGRVVGDVLLKGIVIATTQISGGSVSDDAQLRISGSLIQRSPGAVGVALANENGTVATTGTLVVENTYQVWGGSLILQPLDQPVLPVAPLVFVTFKDKQGTDYDTILNANINTTFGYSVTTDSTSARLNIENNPLVTAITPSSGPTQGSTLVTITGTNFPTNNNNNDLKVYFAGVVATVSGWDGDNIVVIAPPGTGKNRNVCVVINDRGCAGDALATYSYLPPTIDTLSHSNSNPTEGGNTVSIKGSNFGDDESVASVMVGNSSCTVTNITHTSIECTIPKGVGVNNVLTVTINGQEARSAYSYDAPAIWTTSPTSIHTRGGERLLVIGSNFGDDLSLVQVTIDSHACTNLTLTRLEGQSAISCSAPALREGNLDLVVTIGGQKSAASKISVTNPGGKSNAPSVWKQPWWAYLVAVVILVVVFVLGIVVHTYWSRRGQYERVNS